MKKITLLLGFLLALGSCEYPIQDINNWWKEDILKTQEEEETATVSIELSWGEEE